MIKHKLYGVKKYSSDTIKTKWKLSWGKDTFKLLGINFNTHLDKMAKGNYIKTMLIPTLDHFLLHSQTLVNQ